MTTIGAAVEVARLARRLGDEWLLGALEPAEQRCDAFIHGSRNGSTEVEGPDVGSLNVFEGRFSAPRGEPARVAVRPGVLIERSRSRVTLSDAEHGRNASGLLRTSS